MKDFVNSLRTSSSEPGQPPHLYNPKDSQKVCWLYLDEAQNPFAEWLLPVGSCAVAALIYDALKEKYGVTKVHFINEYNMP